MGKKLAQKILLCVLPHTRKILFTTVMFTAGTISYSVYDGISNAGTCRNCKVQADKMRHVQSSQIPVIR